MLSFDAVRLWMRALLRPARVETEMEREMRFHLDMASEQQQRGGVSPDEAARRARVAFGGVERFKEETRDERGVLPLIEFVHDVRYALRGLRNAPGFAAAAVFTLAVGIGAATASSAIVSAVLIHPLPYGHSERLAFLTEATEKGEAMPTSFPNFDDWRARARGFSGLAAYSPAFSNPVIAGPDAVRGRAQFVSRELFTVLGTRPLLGRTLLATENKPGAPPVAVVSEAFWRAHLGARQRLDSAAFQMNGTTFAVVGVMPAGFRIDDDVDIWTALEKSPVMVRGAGNYWVIGRLADGISLAQAAREMAAIAAALKRENGDASVSSKVVVTSLLERVVGDSRRALLMLLVAAALVLLVSCASLAMMQLARGAAREREMNVRTALGAGRMRLVRQLLAEQLTLGALGGLGGVAIAWGAVSVVRLYGSGVLPRFDEVRLDGGVLMASLAAGMLTVVLFGLAPILRLMRRPAAGFSISLRGSTGDRRRRLNMLVGAESALTVVLLVASALLLRSVFKIVTADVGYDRRGLVNANIPLGTRRYSEMQARTGAIDALTASLGSIPGVQSVAFSSQLPFDRGGGNRGPILLPPYSDPMAQRSWAAIASLRAVTPNYFQTLGVVLVKGRLLNDSDREQSNTIVVNRALAAKLWPDEDPIGKQLKALADPRGVAWTVVGVVGDARSWRSPPGSQQELYATVWELPQVAWQLNAVMKVSGAPSQVVTTVRERLRAFDPELPAVIRTFDETVTNSINDRRFVAGVIVAFALIVLALTIAGIFGSVSYAVARRTREIGIRMAIGAPRREVWFLVQRGVLASALVGSAIGVLIAFQSASVVANLLYGITPHDPAVFVAVVVVAIVATTGAAWGPAFRATRIDPAITMRAE